MKKKIRVGVIGFGYWGPNHCRVIQQHKQTELSLICDTDTERLQVATEYYSATRCTNDIEQLLKDDETDAIIIATPVATHASLVTKVLQSNKHVLCEKPLARTMHEVTELKKLVSDHPKKLMCAHIFDFNPVIRYIKEYLKENELGQPLYISAYRNGLGPIRKDINVVFDLACHDISTILYLLDTMPVAVSAVGKSCFNNGIEDVAFINLEFQNKFFVSIQVSWLDPIKERKLRIVGSKMMLLFNDISNEEKLKIYKTGESYLKFDGDFGSFQSTIKDGDIFIPNINYEEPLALQYAHFIDCIVQDKQPVTNITNAEKVVLILELLNQSIKNNGARIVL